MRRGSQGGSQEQKKLSLMSHVHKRLADWARSRGLSNAEAVSVLLDACESYERPAPPGDEGRSRGDG